MNAEFIQAIHDLARERGIEESVLFDAIEAALGSAYKRNFGTSQNVKIDINRATGEIHVYGQRLVVEAVTDTALEISLEEAREINPNYVLGDMVLQEVTPRNFGRIAAQTAKQVVVQRIREAERGQVYDEYTNRELDIVTGVVTHIEGKNVFIELNRTEAVLLATEQVQGERYKPGDRVKAFVLEVKRTTKGPQILVSRSHPGLLKRLLELEVPEIHDGVVELRGLAREAGSRSKIAVWSRDPNVDAVGACVGPKGMRIQTIVNELRGEKIDVVAYDPDPAQYVANALSPAKVTTVNADESTKVARVVVPDYQLSLAIGKEGQNARLAAKMTTWKIDIKSESQAAAAEQEQN
jgi:N utilization substance protein A